jgi:energy-coupling factor transporter ATP-binding protein EcfA2
MEIIDEEPNESIALNESATSYRFNDNTDDLIEIQEISKLLDAYQESDFQTNLAKFNNEITLIIGISGSGKSTVAHFLANNPKLEAKSAQGSSDFYVSDNNENIGVSTITSKTWLPIIVPIPHRQDQAFLDCPGFLDTRSNLHEIATSIFIKNVMKCIKRVKIVVITSHHAVRQGVDRTKFTSLLTNLVGFVKSVEKYVASIALVVNKVENQYSFPDFQLVSDEEMVQQIAGFINDVQQELRNAIQTPENRARDRMLDIFLTKTQGQYTNLGILRRPDRPGLLKDLEILKQQKSDLEDLIYSRLVFSPCDPDNFGLPLSAGALLAVHKTEEKMRSEIQDRISFMCDAVLKKYNFIVQSHFLDCIPFLGPKRPLIAEVLAIIAQIESRTPENFQVTMIFDWFDVDDIDEVARTREELLRLFHDYDFLGSIVAISSNDYRKFFFLFESLRKNLKAMLQEFDRTVCYSVHCFQMPALAEGER